MLDKIKTDLLSAISANDLDVNKINLDGATIRLGGKVLKLTLDKNDDTTTIEQEIRAELQNKLKVKMRDLSSFVDTKMGEAFVLVDSLKSEYLRKEKMLNDKIAKSNPMPDITFEQAQKGLSVIPTNNGIGWLVRRTYWPKFVDDSVIEPKTQKKMITNVVVYIVTLGEKVIELSIRQLANLNTFDQYHRGCWGNWQYQANKIKNANDVLALADQAIAVLERINTMSVARRNPDGLPRLDTLRRNSARSSADALSQVHDMTISNNLTRTGVIQGLNEDVWTSDVS